MVSFAHNDWIIIGIVSIICIWLLWSRFDSRRKQQLESFVAAPLLSSLTPSVSGRRRLIKKVLLLTAIFCCFLALSRPQYGYRWVDVKHKGIDILFALDTSKSMLVEDIRPNRLERSKFAILDFVAQLEGDRVGLLPFSGSSYLMCPLTADYHAFEQSLTAVDTTIIPVGGTDIGDAISSAQNVLRNEANHKILILITDGENLEGDAVAAAKQAQKEHMTIYTVGIGTSEGELIPDTSNGGFIKGRDGSYVKSRLDEQNLITIAETTGGFYVPLGSQGEGLEKIYREKLALIPKTELAEKRQKVPLERFQWPLTLALILLVGEFLLSGRKPKSLFPRVLSRLKKNHTTTKRIIFPVLFLALFSLTAAPLKASEAKEAYDAGNYIEAAEHYRQLLEKDPENLTLAYNLGVTAYKNNLYADALESFEKTLVTDDLTLQEKSYYNLGNTYYRLGENVLSSDPQSTIQQWEQALVSYEGALALNKDNKDAEFNHHLVKSRLEQLKQQQESQQQKDQKNDSEKNEKNQDKSEKSDTQNKDKNGSSQNDTRDQAPESMGDDAKQQPENQSDTQQDSADGSEESAPAAPKNQQKQAGSNTGEQQPSREAADTAVSAAENDPQSMTTEEAEKLLQAVQDEEGRLNFYAPQQTDNENTSRKDW